MQQERGKGGGGGGLGRAEGERKEEMYIDNKPLSERQTHSATAAAILDPVTRVSEPNIDLI